MKPERLIRDALRWAAAVAGLVLVSACASMAPGQAASGRCSYSNGVLALRGPTDQAMLDCVETSPHAATIRVRSPGGGVTTAMRIAERLHAMNAELVIDGYCESSCANYFVPVARRLVVEAGARIVLHGSSDAHMLARTGQAAIFERQRAFVARFDVPLGWLLYRTEAEFRAGDKGRYLGGSADTPPGDDRIAYIVVEERLLRSCFPRLEIELRPEPYAERLRREPSRRARLARQGFYPSGSLECVDPERPQPPRSSE